jgi:inosine/xanthosine triphosphate pyrophosphatase family protein
MTRLIAATQNEAKLDALRRLIGDAAKVLPPPHDISLEDSVLRVALTAAEEGRLPPVGGGGPEGRRGTSVEGIAVAKAVAWSRALPGTMLIASDGGLLIPALGDAWEPTRTRRIAVEGASDLERAQVLLARTAHLQGDDRRISWREGVAIAKDGDVLGQWSAESAPGLLARESDPGLIARGYGFWVDTLWICPESHDRRLAELSVAERAHRGDHWSQMESDVRNFLHMNRNDSLKKD